MSRIETFKITPAYVMILSSQRETNVHSTIVLASIWFKKCGANSAFGFTKGLH